MKITKIISLILAALFVISVLSGCNLAKIASGNAGKTDDTDGRPTGARAEADTASLSKTLEGAKAGDKFTLGSWEQDNNTKNGAEPISWVVLYQDVGKVLVVSEYVLEHTYFKKADKDVKFTRCLYKDSDLRKYLNEDFYNNAFTDKERAVILKTKITTPYVEDYQALSYETEDFIFPLSVDEVLRYISGSGTLIHGVPTEYDREKFKSSLSDLSGVPGIEKAMSWWLRDMGSNSKSAAYVAGFESRPGTYGWDVDYKSGVRPAMWIVYNEAEMKGYANGTVQLKANAELDKKIAALKVGDKVEFGVYDMNPYQLDGYEKMSWTVLDEDSEGFLLFADDYIGQVAFDDEKSESYDPKESNWERSTMRKTINDDTFINGLFDPWEKAKLIKTHVVTENNTGWERDCGGPTDDYLFVPSLEEIEKYFPDESTRGLSEVSYWLRSPDAFAPNIATITSNGSKYTKDPIGYSGCRLMIRIKK